MNELKEICCFCLNVSSVPLKDLFLKSEGCLSNFDKISASLFQLRNILKENQSYKYMLCDKCCDNIELVYRFNQTCLHNVEIYLSYEGNLSVGIDQEQSLKSGNWKEKFSIKTEPALDSVSPVQFKDGLLDCRNVAEVTEICRIDKDKGRKSRRKILKPKRKKLKPKDESNSTSEDENSEVTKELFLNDAEKISNEIDKLGESSTHSQLNIKVKQIGDNKVFVCEICGKTFKQKGNLMSHLLAHSGLKPFICHICGRSFANKTNLKTHINIHTGKKPYKCSTCKLEFSDRTIFSRHKRIHTGIKPYACDQCEQRFTQKWPLTEHKRIHSGEKPYECEVCKRTFTQKSILFRHKRLHTGEKPFSCELCNNSFTQKISLNQHRLKYHNNSQQI